MTFMTPPPGRTVRKPVSKKKKVKFTKVPQSLLHIGEQMRMIREARGLTRRALAKSIMMNESTLWRIETGKSDVSIDAINAYLKHVGATLIAVPLTVPSWVSHAHKAVEVRIKAVKPLRKNIIDDEDEEDESYLSV